ncbi:hypothetical protein [Anaerotignum lactatifermentans]|uniref:hypothetical protein n=1 Tax=Anaerotignum lactatifermentans TaxID=160404 RepID=UPI00255C6DB5|nr:hypothetical protein [Anaerotignum lactatifermentans]
MKYHQKQKLKQKIFAVIALVIALIMVLSLLTPVLAAAPNTQTVTAVTNTDVAEPTPEQEQEKIIGGDHFVLDLQMGFDNSYIVEKVTPMTATLTNNGEAFQGEFQVKVYTYENTDSGFQKYALYSQKLELPEGATKQVSMELGLNTVRRLMEVSLVDEGGNVVFQKHVPVDALSPETVAVGVLSEQPAQVQYLAGMNLSEKTSVFFLDRDTFPESQSVMENFVVLIIDDFDTATLGDAQKKALKNWVDNGGLLVLGTGVQAQKVLSGLDFVDVSLNGTQSVSGISAPDGTALSLSEPLTVAGISAEKASVKWEANGTPLTSLMPYGGGYVLLNHFALGLAPFANMPQQTAVLKGLCSGLYDAEGENAGAEITNQLRYAANSFPSVTGNSIVVIFLAVGIYIVLAGPVMYLVLKKKDRRELGWITIPVLSVVFFGVVFLLAGRSTYHNGMISTKAIVEMEEGSSVGEAQIAMAMKVPGNGDVTLESELPISVQPQLDNGWYDGNGKAEEIDYKVTTGDGTNIVFYDNMAWETNFVGASATLELGGSVTSNVAFDGEKVVGTVTNGTSVNFMDAYLKLDYVYIPLGELPAGETMEVSYDLSTENINDRYGERMTNLITGDSTTVWDQVQNGTITEERGYTLRREQELMEILHNWDDTEKTGWENSQITYEFFGFSDMPIFDSVKYLNGKTAKENQLSMFHTVGTKDLSREKSFDLPFTVLPETTDQAVNYGVHYDNWNNFCEVNNYMDAEQEVVLQYVVGEGVRIDEIQFAFDESYGSGMYADPQVYNVKTGQWEDFVETPYVPGEDYINEERVVQFKMYLEPGVYTHAPRMRVKGGGLYA